jgi:HSP20 family protein
MPRSDWDPLKELVSVQQRMNKLFESALARTNFDDGSGVGAWTPVADVFETDERIVFCLELPGLELADIDLKMDGDELVVQGERRMDKDGGGEQYHRVERAYGTFLRKFPLPSFVDRESAHASYQNGVLEISLRKVESRGKRPIKLAIR